MKKDIIHYDVRKIRDVKDLINSSAEIYQDKAAYPASSFTDRSGNCGDTPTYPSIAEKDYILLW